MMRRYFSYLMLSFVLIFTTARINAQEVIASTGSHFESDNVTLSFTIGETFIQTFSNSNNTLTQGFHQTELVVTSIYTSPHLEVDVKAYPNPTTDYLIIHMNEFKGYTYFLFDLSGKLINQQEIENIETEISFINLLPSIYILKIVDQNSYIKTFKIIKQ